MKNTNLISTPNITGNIGSCTTNKIEIVMSRNGLFTTNNRTITTNSCTGEVNTYDYWELSGISSTLIVFVFLALIIFVINRI